MIQDGMGEFPGGPVLGLSTFTARDPGFDPWSGNQDPAEKKEKEKKKDGIGMSHKICHEIPEEGQ